MEEISVAAPGRHEVRVDIAVCAICHSDVSYVSGAWGGSLPTIYGHEAAGTVESVGRDVTSVQLGQRVIVGLLRTCGDCFHCTRGEDNLCIGKFEESSPFKDARGESIGRGLRTGAFCEQTVVHHSQVAPIPDDVPMEAACLLACGVITGFGSVVNTADVAPGSTVAVIGTGGVGMSVLQGAVYRKADLIIAVDIVDSKLEAATEFGATCVINSMNEDAVAVAKELTAGVGPDYVFVAVGAGFVIDQALAMVRRGGTVVLVGMPPSGVMTQLESTKLAEASQTIIGSKLGSSRMTTDIPVLLDLYRNGNLRLDEMISSIYGVEDINAALTDLKSGSALRNLIRFR